MKCSELMRLDLQWVSGGASARDAARLMRDHSMGLLLVSGAEPGLVMGVLTDRDLATRVCAEDKPAADVKVLDVASRQLVTCDEGESLAAAEKKMKDEQKSRLVVLNQQGHAVGVLSLTDIIVRDRASRAIKTARAVLSREADGPHTPIEQIALTPSTPEDEEAVSHDESVITGRTTGGTFKMFP